MRLKQSSIIEKEDEDISISSNGRVIQLILSLTHHGTRTCIFWWWQHIKTIQTLTSPLSLWHRIALHLVHNALWLFQPTIQPKLANYRMLGDNLQDSRWSGGYRNSVVEKGGHITHHFPTIESFQNYC